MVTYENDLEEKKEMPYESNMRNLDYKRKNFES